MQTENKEKYRLIPFPNLHSPIKKPENFSDALAEYGSEGIEIVTTRSGRWAYSMTYIMAGLLLSLLIWSFVGKADVMVSAEGELEPKSEMRQIYLPVAGELIDIYVSEGMSVSAGDLLARIKSPDAIKIAADAVQSKLQMEQMELDRKVFPQKKRLSEQEIENTEEQIRHKQKEYDQLRLEKFRNLPETQQNKVLKSRLQLDEAENTRAMAKQNLEKYKRLYQSDGHGGISKKELEDKESEYLKAETAYRALKLDSENMELEFAEQDSQTGKKLAEAYLAMLALRLQQHSKTMEIRDQERNLDMKYRAAKASYEAASVITFDDLDADNFLKIRSPVSGVITNVASKQRGEKIKEDAPLISIAPQDAEKVVMLRIPDKDRGLLQTGQPVKLKFAAFPYQRYGLLHGTLEYIAPSAIASKQGNLFYHGRVGLARDYVNEDGKVIPLRYGMTANAEIAVQKRRLIDLVLDPFRKLKPSES